MIHIRKPLTLAALLLSLTLSQAASALSIYDIIMLSSNKHEPAAIIQLIEDTGSAFSLEAMDAVRLKDAGVADDVVAAMFRAKPAELPEDADVAETELPAPATLADVLLLTEGGIAREVILAFVESRGIGFVPDATAVTRLRTAGLDDYIINKMLTMTPQVAGPAQAQIPRQQTYSPPPQAYQPVAPEPAAQPMQSYVVPQESYVLPEASYAYPVYYYGPSYFVGFSGIHHSMFRHRYTHAHPYPGYWYFAQGKHHLGHGGKDWHKGGHGNHGGKGHDHDWNDRDDDERPAGRIDGGRVYDGNDRDNDRGSKGRTSTKKITSQPTRSISAGLSAPSAVSQSRENSPLERYSRTPGDMGWGSGRSSSSLQGNSVTGSGSSSTSRSLGTSSTSRSLGTSSSVSSSRSSSSGSVSSSRSSSSGSRAGSSRSSSSDSTNSSSSTRGGSSFERHMNTPASSSMGWGSGRSSTSSNARSAGSISRPR